MTTIRGFAVSSLVVCAGILMTPMISPGSVIPITITSQQVGISEPCRTRLDTNDSRSLVSHIEPCISLVIPDALIRKLPERGFYKPPEMLLRLNFSTEGDCFIADINPLIYDGKLSSSDRLVLKHLKRRVKAFVGVVKRIPSLKQRYAEQYPSVSFIPKMEVLYLIITWNEMYYQQGIDQYLEAFIVDRPSCLRPR